MSPDPTSSGARMRQGLLAIYEAVDRDVAAAAPVCEISGRCCRFQEYGHRLYISRPEAELLLENGLPADAVIDDGFCPFQQERLCTARERRPLGCRIFFCDPSYSGRMEELSEQSLAQLKQLHQEVGQDWEYGPLHEFLREAAPTPSPSRSGDGSRMSDDPSPAQ